VIYLVPCPLPVTTWYSESTTRTNEVLAPLLGHISFTDLAFSVATDAAGKPVLVKYGTFLQTCFEFLIIAFALMTMGALAMTMPAMPLPASTAILKGLTLLTSMNERQ
jgi:large-conductance mechanosensitive channel